jgi:OmcA/MtrC family decaheme c-type cytochrome
MRLAIQISASDLPTGSNGWCDFDADTSFINNDCDSASLTRDIVQTDTCNRCHGATDEVMLALHGGGRTEVEYCVTCHNPGSTDANSGNTVDFSVMPHKIHAGASLTNDYKIWGFRNSLHDYSHVNFTAELSDCTICHTGGGLDEDNWATVPNAAACGSCHDDVDFAAGINHPQVTDNASCTACHPEIGTARAVRVAHTGEARNAEAALYAGGSNGFLVEALTWDPSLGELWVDYSVTRAGTKMDLETDPEWTAGGSSRLAVSVAWATEPDYTNDGSGATPAEPMSFNALDIDPDPAIGDSTPIGGNVYRVVADLPSGAFDTVTATLDGHPAADLNPLDADDTLSDSIAVRSALLEINIENRGSTIPRRTVVNVDLCNQCHDSGRQGISLHGHNRTSEPQVCVVCHTPNSTDINRRPADPNDTIDGKREEAIDFKRMIHQIHSGSELQDGIVVWGFGFPGTEHDFRQIDFIGDLKNCETCHYQDTYNAEDAWAALPTTIDTGADASDPDDDLNISSVAAVCSACHDDDVAKGHMLEQGASFIALDADIQ